MANKTKCTPEVRAKILSAIRLGAYVETASALAGVSKQTFYTWLREGAERRNKEKIEFAAAVEESMAYAELKDLSIIRRAAEGGAWVAAAWRLERKHPERWSRNRRIEDFDEAKGDLARFMEKVNEGFFEK